MVALQVFVVAANCLLNFLGAPRWRMSDLPRSWESRCNISAALRAHRVEVALRFTSFTAVPGVVVVNVY